MRRPSWRAVAGVLDETRSDGQTAYEPRLPRCFPRRRPRFGTCLSAGRLLTHPALQVQPSADPQNGSTFPLVSNDMTPLTITMRPTVTPPLVRTNSPPGLAPPTRNSPEVT